MEGGCELPLIAKNPKISITMISLSPEEGCVKIWTLYDEKQKCQIFDNLGASGTPKMGT